MGLVAATLAQYSLLIGASIIFVVLIGNFMHEIVCQVYNQVLYSVSSSLTCFHFQVPSRFWMLCVGLIAFLILFAMPALKKAKPIAYFAGNLPPHITYHNNSSSSSSSSSLKSHDNVDRGDFHHRSFYHSLLFQHLSRHSSSDLSN